MRKLLNTLYVTTPESYLFKDGLNVVVKVHDREIFRIPVHNIEQIVMFGYMGASPGVMKLCADNGVALNFLSPNGRFIGHFQGSVHGNVLLRKAQYKQSEDDSRRVDLCRLFIAGKIQNCRNILRRFIRDNGGNQEVSEAAENLDRCKQRVLDSQSVDSIRGIEGEAANYYFGVFSNLILQQKTDFVFNGRNRRPPKDAVNAMLSFVYTLLCNDMTAALETVGLDPYVGFMHTLRPGRTSLSLDLMEELRAYMADRLVLSLINLKQVSIRDFVQQGEDGIVMTDVGRKNILGAWQTRKRETICHPYLNEKIEIGLLPYVQATLLARFIRGDMDNYPVFLIP